MGGGGGRFFIWVNEFLSPWVLRENMKEKFFYL